MSDQTFVITLTQRDPHPEHQNQHCSDLGFRSLQRDYQIIYENFSLLSYLTPQCEVVIHDRFKYQDSSDIEVDKFRVQNQEIDYSESGIPFMYLFQTSRDKFKNEENMESYDFCIKYTVGDRPNQVSKENRISVIFKAEIRNLRQYINITIKDQDGWVKNNFASKIQNFPLHRISERWKMTDKELQYFYQEPLSRRNKKINGKHFSLALQGGGVKGVAYIGGYKAIKKQYPEIPIKSIIGSSAGGMLGLAICCQMTEDEMIKLCQNQLSHITDDQKYSEVDQTEAKRMLKIIRQFFIKFGIFHEDVMQLATDILTDKDFGKAVLQLLQAYNPAIKDLFAVGPNKDQLSVRGLLEAALMSGDSIKNFAITCIKSLRTDISQIKIQEWQRPMQYERDRMRNNASKIKPHIENHDEWAESLTFEEFYEITNTQFTCTSVDVNDNVLRFFNNKTTPHMPVCKAVQMTGSFPVAFESQKWDTKNWGKYYIHFDHCRREVDLDGHQFTDGGVLANFPVKYLDNQYMRPMYFSHAKVDDEKDKTIIFGFGLNSIKPPQDLSVAMLNFKQSVTRVVNRYITWTFKMKAMAKGVTSDFWNTVQVNNTSNDDNNPIKMLKKIPLIDFISKVLNTYIKTKDNLTEECFGHRIFETEIGKSYEQMIQQQVTLQKILLNVQNFKAKFQEYLQPIKPTYKEEILQCLYQNIISVETMIQKHPKTEKNLLELNTLLRSAIANLSFTQVLLSLKPDAHRYKIQGPEIRVTFKEEILYLDEITKNKIFVYSQIKGDYQKMVQILDKLRKWLQNSQQTSREGLLNMLLAIRQDEYSKLVEAYDNFHSYYQDLKLANERTQVEAFSMKQEVAYAIFNTKKWSLTSSIQKSLQFQQAIEKSGIPKLEIGYKSFKNQMEIESYVTELISQREKRVQDKSKKAEGVHIILESINFSELYFHEYLSAVQNAILNYNIQRRQELKKQNKEDEYKEIKITSMTGSNFHSLIMFLYACNLPVNEITGELWKIQNLIKVNSMMLPHKLTDEEWKQISKSNALKMKTIADKAWQNRVQIFEQVDSLMQKKYSDVSQNRESQEQIKAEMDESINDLKYRANESADSINSAIESSLNYVVDQLLTLNAETVTKQNIQKVCQNLVFNIGDHKYLDDAKKICSEKKGLLQYFSKRYMDLIKFLFFSSSYMSEGILLNIHGSTYQKEAWKALIFDGILNTFEVRRYVCDKLKKIGLSETSTLQEFYHLSQNKILLNFAAIQSQHQRIRFYNHKTRPNMPVWAAIVSTCCIPDFFSPLPDRQQWRYKPSHNKNDRLVKDYFDDEDRSTNYLTSAEIITKMPMQLLTNEKLKQKITNTPNQVYVGFNFTDFILKPINTKLVPNITSNYMNAFDLYWQQDHLAYIGSLKDLPGLTSLTNRLSLYSNSHDNLITGLYKHQLAKLPIIVETLDFDKILEGDHLSPAIQDTIMQCQFVIKQKMQNGGVLQQTEHVMYFAIQNGNKPKQLIFRHLSANNPTQSLYEKYKVFIQSKSHKFLEFKKERLPINLEQNPTISIRIEFPKQNHGQKLTRQIRYHQINLEELLKYQDGVQQKSEAERKFCYVYKLAFNHFYEEQQVLRPEQTKFMKEPVNIDLKSFLMPDSIPKFRLVCDKCNNTDDWHVITINQLKEIQGLTAEQRKKNKIQCFSCLKNPSNHNQNDILVKYQYRCNNPRCKAIYCASCKYKIYIDEHQNLASSLNGNKLNKVFDYENHQKDIVQFLQCSLCQGYNTNYYMHDEESQVYICQSCTILKLFKTSDF